MRHGLAALALVLALASPAHAELIDLGNGMIYDTFQDLTWLQDIRYAWSSGYDTTGGMTYAEAQTWVSQLVFGIYDDWRLPAATPWWERPPVWEQPWSEISGVLLQLGWEWLIDPDGGAHYYSEGSLGPFLNYEDPTRPPAMHYQFWAVISEQDNHSDVWNSGWDMDIADGGEGNRFAGAWAVRDGLARVPEPSTLALVGIGVLAGLVRTGRHRAKKRF